MQQILWLVLIVVFAVIEAVSLDLNAIWFSFGALVALIASLFTSSIIAQIVFFIIGSTLVLIYLKPVAKKYLFKDITKTNIDRIIGQTAIVTREITNLGGEVSVFSNIWLALNVENDQTIEVGKKVEVLEIQGVKLIVKEI